MTLDWKPADADLVGLVYREARLLDTRDFDAWYELYSDDCRYWLPTSPAQTEWRGTQSIVLEDKLMLRVRVERLKSPKAYSQQPAVLCQHVLQAPSVEEADHAANRYRTRTPFLYAEHRHDDVLSLVGVAGHTLRVDGGALRIVEKRIDLLNARSPLPGIFLMP